MTGIQPNAPKTPLPIQTTTTQHTQPKAEENKSKSTAIKVAVGTGLAALAALGIYAVTKGKGGGKSVKEAADNISKIKNELTQKISHQKENKSEMFDADLLQGHFDEISKLPKEKQAKAMEDMHETMSDWRYNAVENLNPEEIKTLPKEVQDAIASKDQLKAGQEYIKYCDNLFEPTTFNGKPVEEAITSVLGKDSKVKPHTYDMSKEADRIGLAQHNNGRGFYDTTVMADNKIVPDENIKNQLSGMYCNSTVPTGANAFVFQGNKEGKPFVQISYKGIDGENNAIRLISPNGELTPAQQDLLKLQDHAETLDVQDLQHATASWLNLNGKSGDPTDFNVILSVIQDMASKVK